MEFRAHDYGSEIARILELGDRGRRLLPLVRANCLSDAPMSAVKQLGTHASVRAGLWLYFGCWDEAHTTADSLENPDGYFWHAIVHRQEPDPANSGYWFRMAGVHPVFAKLAREATAAGYPSGPAWDPFAFIEFCESARRHPGSKEELLAMTVQRLEWQLLFDHCARNLS